MKSLLPCLCCLLASSFLFSQKWTETKTGTIATVANKDGQTLGYSTTSGIKLITVDGFAFKDLNRNGKLDKYEDWRLPVAVRAKDLASKMSVAQIAGLMLYSRHQPIPAAAAGPFAGTYNGKKLLQKAAHSLTTSPISKKIFLQKIMCGMCSLLRCKVPAWLHNGTIMCRRCAKALGWVFLPITAPIRGMARLPMPSLMPVPAVPSPCGPARLVWLRPSIPKWCSSLVI